MKYFSVPADFKCESAERLYNLNYKYDTSKIIELYGQLTDLNDFNSGRARELLPQVDVKTFEKYVKFLADKGIEFNYTLNSSCMGNFELSVKGIRRINEILGLLYNLGVSSITVAMPSLIELIKASPYKFKIKASTICQISSANKALYYKKLGADRIVVDEDITRKFGSLKEICNAFGKGVEIIVNSGCYNDCPYKMFHYNHESHTHENSESTVTSYFYHRCMVQKAIDLRNVLKLNFIRPEDLKYYSETGFEYFKIQGRHSVVKGDVVKTLEHYINESFYGNMFDLITLFTKYNNFHPYIDNKKLDGFIAAFFNNHNFCSANCDTCKYCMEYALKSMDPEEAGRLNKQIVSFYRDFDNYTDLLDEQQYTEPSEDDLVTDFDLD